MDHSTNSGQLTAAIKQYACLANPDAMAAIARKLYYDSKGPQYTALLLMKMLEDIDPDIQSLLGDCYYRGEGVRKDIDKSLVLFQSAAGKGSRRADYDLAWYYYDRDEYVRAIEYFKRCISPDSTLEDRFVSRSYRCIGNSYASMPGPDMQQAVSHWTIASDKYHDAFASKKLGLWYSESGTDHFDASRCQYYLNLAAKQGDAEAAHRLAQFYMFGEESLGISSDGLKAQMVLRPFANGNNTDILNDLGILYRRGEGVAKDYELSKKCFEKSWSIMQTPWLAAQLGYVYFLLDEYSNARKKLEFADNGGCYYYSDFLGRMYKDGLGGSEDVNRAERYYRNCFDSDNISNLFTCCEYLDVLMDLGQYKKAYEVAEYGEKKYNDIYFAYWRARMVLENNANGMSQADAAALMEEATEFDTHKVSAHELLSDYYIRARQHVRAAYHLNQLFEGGDADAAVKIGKLYESGSGSLGMNIDMAMHHYKMAADAGSALGKAELACFSKGLFGGYKRIKNL